MPNGSKGGNERELSAPVPKGPPALKDSERADKPNSVPVARRRSFLWARGLPRARAADPETVRRSGTGRAPSVSLFGLAPHGVYRAPSVAVGAVRSYRTVSPLPSRPKGAGKAVCFLWHFPSRRRDRALPGMLPVWSSDFPPRSLGAIAWPARSRQPFYQRRDSGSRRRSSGAIVDVHASASSPPRPPPRRSAPRSPSGAIERAPASFARRARPRSAVTTTTSRRGAAPRDLLRRSDRRPPPPPEWRSDRLPSADAPPGDGPSKKRTARARVRRSRSQSSRNERAAVLLGRPRRAPRARRQIVAVEKVRQGDRSGTRRRRRLAERPGADAGAGRRAPAPRARPRGDASRGGRRAPSRRIAANQGNEERRASRERRRRRPRRATARTERSPASRPSRSGASWT